MEKKLDFIKLIKIAAGATLAIVLADGLGLKYSASAGIITLLSIQDTKKETIRVVLRRLLSFGISLVIAFGCFTVFGYGAPAAGVFLLLFSAVCMRFKMQEGISVNSVLMTHFLAERSMSAANMGNELAILVIGAGIGVILNLYIPGKKKQIRTEQYVIEERMRKVLGRVAGQLSDSKRDPEYSTQIKMCLAELERELSKGEKSAYEDMENKLLVETRYYLHYMNMRRSQAAVLERMAADMGRIAVSFPQAEEIAALIGDIGASFQEYNNAVELLRKLESVKESMRGQPLPADREEFENRAVLFTVLLELEQFLDIKKQFVEELTDSEIKEFWEFI